jgi:chorismate synthase
MSGNIFGSRFSVITFGESHGVALGAVIDGCPAGVIVDPTLIQRELQRRRPGANSLSSDGIVSPRNEPDKVEILSGIFEGQTLGTPIAMVVRNTDQRSEDYGDIRSKARPGHADDVWKSKYLHVDHRGGGRSSGRETLGRVLGGSIAKMFVNQVAPLCDVVGFTCRIGPMELNGEDYNYIRTGVYLPEDFSARFPSGRHAEVREMLVNARVDGESYGGVAEIWVRNPPPHLGQPVFAKFKATLAQAMMSVGATVGIEVGEGFAAASEQGTRFHDPLHSPGKYGGIRGGFTTGELVSFKVAFKPTSSVLDVAKQGRHDPCIVIRAIPVLEAMTWLTLADHILWARQDRV